MPGLTIVEASAGSGKTFELAGQFVRLLIDEDSPPPAEILAVTFTNKAALEMKERVLSFLKKTALGRFESRREEGAVLRGKSGSGRPAGRAVEAVEEILSDYSRFRVQTIDSLVHSIIEASPMELSLPARFRVKTDFSSELEFAVDRLINLPGETPGARRTLLNFLDCYLSVENKTGWFPKKDMIRVISLMLSMLNSYGKNIARGEGRGIRLLKKEIFKTLEELRGRLPEGTRKSLVKLLEGIESPDDVRTDRIINRTSASSVFPVKKGFEAPDDAVRLWKDFRELLRELCETEAATRFNPYIDVFRLAEKKLSEMSKEQESVFLQEINRLASPAFGQNLMEPGDLYLRLASRFSHYMLDEFQDTSLLQWDNLAPLVDEALSSGGSFFCVGDRKQAIYRFRGGDYTLAGRIRETLGRYGENMKTLSENFRSQREIVLFNNYVFGRPSLERFLCGLEEETLTPSGREDILEVFSNSKQSWQEENDSGYVRTEFIFTESSSEQDEEIERRIVPLAADLSQRFGGEAAILTRDNKSAETVSSWLIASGIRVSSERTLDVTEHVLVKEIISLLRFLASPVDDISFASFIQGRVYLAFSGIAAEEMRALIRSRPRGGEKSRLYVHFRKHMPEAWERDIEPLFRIAGFSPLYEYLLEIIRRFRVLENFPGSHAFVMKFLETAVNSESEQEDAGIHSFLEFLEAAPEEELHLSNTGGDSLNVLTIHKAKGLEFDAVLLPFFEITVRPGAGAGPAVADASGEMLRLLRLPSAYTMVSSELARVYGEEYKRAVIDELNTAYVALTRARRELYVFVPERRGGRKNRAGLIVPENHVKGKRARRAPAGGGGSGRFLSPSPSSVPPGFLKEEPGGSEPLKRSELMSGEAVHFILSEMGSFDETRMRKATRRARMKGLEIMDEDRALEKIRDLFRDPGFSKIYYPSEEGRVYTEQELVDSSGRTKRIDRLVVEEEIVRVMDFKMSESAFDDADQIRGYLVAVKKIFPGKQAEGFLVYINEGKTVKVDG